VQSVELLTLHSFATERKYVILIAYLRLISLLNSLICSDYVIGIGAEKSLVIHGCFRAFSDVYLSIGVGLHSFRKRSLARWVNFELNSQFGFNNFLMKDYSLS
jgi:hypothetical protein